MPDSNKSPQKLNPQEHLSGHESDPQKRSLLEAHERFGIPINVGEIIDQSLQANGFTELKPRLTPSVEEWIHERMSTQGYAGYNLGSFVTDAAGNIGFAKTHYGPDNVVLKMNDQNETEESIVGGPKREAEVLTSLTANGYEAPQVLSYSPEFPEGASSADAELYEVLVIEAILPKYGAVREREDWTPELSKIAAQKIATFAKPIGEIDLFKNEKIPLTAEDLIEKIPTVNGAYEQIVLDTLSSYKHLDAPIVVHGDTWFNNIIATHDDTDLLFVDWELAGPGYQGQDAGRKLWDLTLTNTWDFSEYSEPAAAFTEEWCKTEDDRDSLAFGVAYESLRWLSDRYDQINNPDTDQATRISLEQEIEDVKSHAIKIINEISSR